MLPSGLGEDHFVGALGEAGPQEVVLEFDADLLDRLSRPLVTGGEWLRLKVVVFHFSLAVAIVEKSASRIVEC